MEIGVPKETKDQEFRVGLSPSSVRVLRENGHTIFVQTQAGTGAGFSYPPTLNVPLVYGDVIPPLPEKKKNTDTNNTQK